MPSQNTQHLRLLLSVVSILILLPLLSHVVLGIHNRPFADDYCFTVTAQSKGIVGAMDWNYNHWTGTYSSTFFQSAIGLSASWQFTPLILMSLFVTASLWTAHQLALTFQFTHRWLVTGVVAMLFSFGIISGTANVFQSFYWTSGSITYASPLIVLLFHVGILIALFRTRSALQLWHLILIAVLALLSGGFSPLYAVFQVTFFGLSILLSLRYSPSHQKRYHLLLLSISLIFALIALLILFIAPGNLVRQAAFEIQVDLIQVILITLVETIRFLPSVAVVHSPMALIIPLAISGVVAFYCHPLTPMQRHTVNRYSLKALALSALLGHILIASSFFTTIYSIGNLPPPRAYVVMQTAIILTSMTWGYIMGLGLQKRYAQSDHEQITPALFGIIVVLVAVASLESVSNTLSLVPAFQTFANEWDTRDAYLTSLEPNQDTLELAPFTEDIAAYAWHYDMHLGCIQDYYHQPNLMIPESETTPIE